MISKYIHSFIYFLLYLLLFQNKNIFYSFLGDIYFHASSILIHMVVFSLKNLLENVIYAEKIIHVHFLKNLLVLPMFCVSSVLFLFPEISARNFFTPAFSLSSFSLSSLLFLLLKFELTVVLVLGAGVDGNIVFSTV